MPAASQPRPFGADSTRAGPHRAPPRPAHPALAPLMRPRPTTIRLRARVLVAALGVTLGVRGGHRRARRRTRRRLDPHPRPRRRRRCSRRRPPSCPGLPTTSLELAGVPVTSPAFDQAATDYGEVDALHSEVRARRHDLDHTTTVLQGRVRELDNVRASASARIAGLSSRLDAIDGAIQELAVRAFVAGDDDERTYEALVSETPAVSDLERRDVLGGPHDGGAPRRTGRLPRRGSTKPAHAPRRRRTTRPRPEPRSRSSARSDRPRCGMRSTRPDGSPRSASPTKRHACSPRSRAWSSRSSPSTPTTARQRRSPRRSPRAACAGGASRASPASRGATAPTAAPPSKPNGDTTRRIIGIQLNGSRETAVVGDSDGGALDGDASLRPRRRPDAVHPADVVEVPSRRQRRRHDLAVQPLRRDPGGRELPVHLQHRARRGPRPAHRLLLLQPLPAPTWTPCSATPATTRAGSTSPNPSE